MGWKFLIRDTFNSREQQLLYPLLSECVRAKQLVEMQGRGSGSHTHMPWACLARSNNPTIPSNPLGKAVVSLQTAAEMSS